MSWNNILEQIKIQYTIYNNYKNHILFYYFYIYYEVKRPKERPAIRGFAIIIYI